MPVRAWTALLEEWNDINSILKQPTEVLAASRSSHFRCKPSPRSQPFRRDRGLPSHGHRPTAQPSSTKTGSCDSCGGNHQRSTCRFRQADCHICNKRGHIARVCRLKAKSTNAVTVDSDNEFEVFTVGKKATDRLYHKVVFDNGKERELIIDTGSPVSLMPL